MGKRQPTISISKTRIIALQSFPFYQTLVNWTWNGNPLNGTPGNQSLSILASCMHVTRSLIFVVNFCSNIRRPMKKKRKQILFRDMEKSQCPTGRKFIAFSCGVTGFSNLCPTGRTMIELQCPTTNEHEGRFRPSTCPLASSEIVNYELQINDMRPYLLRLLLL